MKTLTFDVVIPTHRNLALKGGSLELVLFSIRTADYQPRQIIVVSNGDDDERSRDWLRESICKKYECTLHEIGEGSRSKSRNVGVQLSSSEYVLFSDDDVIAGDDALALAVDLASARSFSCGAIRRFLSLHIPREQISALVHAKDWEAIDRIANDTRVPGIGSKVGFRGLQYHSSYVGCFGMVPRWAFDEAGRFDERYEGWGLEDTDLMRRLVRLVGHRSLKRSTVWHVDHPVSPYIWEEQWGTNLRLYCDEHDTKAMLDVGRFFSVDSFEADDDSILIPRPQFVHPKDDELLLDPKHMDALGKYFDMNAQDDSVAAVILTGSSLRSDNPKDLDVERVLFWGDEGCKQFEIDGITFDERSIRYPVVQSTIHKPFYYPETWPWLAHRYADGSYILQKIDLQRVFNDDVQTVIGRYRLHFLTFHLGRAAQAVLRAHLADRYAALKECAVLACFAQGCLPDRMVYPYSSNPEVEAVLRRVECALQIANPGDRWKQAVSTLRNTVETVVGHYKPGANCDSVFYTASMFGISAMVEMGMHPIEPKWGTLTSDQTASEKMVELYGLTHAPEKHIRGAEGSGCIERILANQGQFLSAGRESLWNTRTLVAGG